MTYPLDNQDERGLLTALDLKSMDNLFRDVLLPLRSLLGKQKVFLTSTYYKVSIIQVVFKDPITLMKAKIVRFSDII